MASTASGGGAGFEERAVFVRKATGLVRGWSVRDAFVYATFAINLVTLGWLIFTYAPFIPGGGLMWSVIVGGAFLIFQAITYASLISVMPRAGGDYVWMSRVLGGGIGFVLAVAGWWFILWYWVPIYANILNIEVFGPLSAIVGWSGGVTFWASHAGVFVASVITALLASLFIGLGIRTYGRIQKFCFYGGVFGLAVMAIILLVTSHSGFISDFNSQAHKLYGTTGNAYAATLKAGTKGYSPTSIGSFGGVLLLIPMLLFFNLWSNWGATLYGEVRGASDFRKNIYAMGGALIVTTIVAVIFFLLFSKTFGWTFYMGSSSAYWAGTIPIGVFPYPALLAAMVFSSPVLQFILIAIMSLWFFGWVGSVFLSSTRVVFAASFDRILPERVASVSKNGVPYWALALMLLPSIPLAALYAWSSSFASYTLDATLVIAITFLGTTVSAAILPWRKPEIYNASPIAKYRVLGLPIITAAALMFSVILIWALIKWFTDDAYGVNNTDSYYLMGGMYVLAIAIYVGSQIVRKRQGIDLGMVYGEIPAE
ncbi:MAG TPA: APC family permease [Solirubrobacteraceae bacterium]|jgi:amino acid transporter|nr:APC family permease [Solirubrobacteraceae bacterium]